MAANPESLTPDAALLREATKLIGSYGIVGGNYIFDRLVEALRAALDRERETKEHAYRMGYRAGWIDSDIPVSAFKEHEDGNWAVFNERKAPDTKPQRANALAAELQRLKEGQP